MKKNCYTCIYSWNMCSYTAERLLERFSVTPHRQKKLDLQFSQGSNNDILCFYGGTLKAGMYKADQCPKILKEPICCKHYYLYVAWNNTIIE